MVAYGKCKCGLTPTLSDSYSHVTGHTVTVIMGHDKRADKRRTESGGWSEGKF